MKDALDQNIRKIAELEGLVLNTNQALIQLLENQISLDVHFQELIKTKQIEHVAVNSASKIEFIPVNEIVYCKANLAYTELFSLNDHVLTASKSLNEVENQLSNSDFFRISKSLLINTNHVYSFNKRSHQVLMKNNVLLDVSRRKKVEFLTTILNEVV